MLESPARLDPRSEMLVLATYGDTRNVVLTAIEVMGPFDVDAGWVAIERASREFPQVMSCIREIKVRGRYYLVWDRRSDLPLSRIFTELPRGLRSEPLLEALLKHLAPWLDRDWNLFEETAARIHFVRVSPDHHVLISAFHHVASDAGTASEFGRSFLAHYHQIVTGRHAEWAQEAHAISSSSKRRVKIRQPNWRERLASVRQTIDNIFEKPTLPVGTGRSEDSGQHLNKRVLSEEVTEKIARSSTANGVSFIDLLTACANLAIDRWNESRNVKRGILTTSMTVNTRGRYVDHNQPNNSSVIFFKSFPEERTDTRKFSRSLALTRIKHFRNQMDLKYMHDIERMMNLIRLFPFKLRRRIVHRVVNRHQFSIGVTLLGVLWPKMKNGKPTAETVFKECGNVTVSEVHGIGYKLLSSTRVVLIVYAFRNKMNLILASHACLFTRQEAEEFLDLIVKNLVDRAEPESSRDRVLT
ncbi:MAG: condensation domain-containing protein [Desulfomonilaceae bacterium]|nr:condensation domain-containing protein [Desulfomonilaceae bacterium]